MDMVIIGLGIFLALMFNFVNGLNDAANSIAAVIATRALSPIKAIALASVCCLIGPLLFTTAIAETIGENIVSSSFLSIHLIFSAMVGAVLWVYLASRFGIPVSSSHALVGGLVGAGFAVGGLGAIIFPDMQSVIVLIVSVIMGGFVTAGVMIIAARMHNEDGTKYIPISFLAGIAFTVPILIFTGAIRISGLFAVIIFIVVSPMLGMISAFLFGIVIMRVCRRKNPQMLDKRFRSLQVVTCAFQAIGHGANDAQNAMGIITAMLLAAGMISSFQVPLWVILTSCFAISLGTFLGGQKVIDKMANKITRIRPYQGVSAAASGSLVLSFMTALGVPVSTTHAISGAIMGAGLTRGYTSAVQWTNVREIVAAWFLTIPCAAVVSGLVYFVYSLIML
ncbi:MAG: inorganic phosphate transporter [Methanomicrobium sp.]|nr:inorganic phosphate transporter [Methanomicrobium sp.]